MIVIDIHASCLSCLHDICNYIQWLDNLFHILKMIMKMMILKNLLLWTMDIINLIFLSLFFCFQQISINWLYSWLISRIAIYRNALRIHTHDTLLNQLKSNHIFSFQMASKTKKGKGAPPSAVCNLTYGTISMFYCDLCRHYQL